MADIHKKAAKQHERNRELKNKIQKKPCPVCGHHKARYKPKKAQYKCCKCKSIFDETHIVKEKEPKKKGWLGWLK